MQRKAWIKPGYSPAWGIDQTPGIGSKWMNTKRRIISAHLSYRFSHFMMATAAMAAGADGKPGAVLDQDARATQRNLADAAVKAYCKPAAPGGPAT